MATNATLDTAVFNFYQECNTNGTTGKFEDVEKLSITMESVLGGLDEDGGFLVFRTEGWSINDLSDLDLLIKQIKNINFNTK